MIKYFYGLWLLVFTLVMGGTVMAQSDTDTTYGGLDIVFLVDQSGSMGGASYGYEGEGSDPLDLRFGAIDYAIDALGQYRLNLAPDVAMQIAVVNFGDESSLEDITRGWLPIAASGNRDEWDALYATLSDELSSESFRERSTDNQDYLGNTNFLDAFSAAAAMFNQLPDDSTEPHLRVVILLTDGAPCVPADFTCGEESGQNAHMAALGDFVDDAFPTDRYILYVIALDAQNDFWPVWVDEWQQITGHPTQAARAETNQQVGVRFYNIMIELVNRVRGTEVVDSQTLQPGENVIFLPPYLAEARFSIFKSNTSPGVLQIIRPDGREIISSDAELIITDPNRPIEIWTVLNPIPGEWIIIVGSTDDRIDVYLELIPIEVRATLTESAFIQFTDVEMSFELTDSDDNPLLILNDPYDLNVTMSIIQPDGTSISRPLSYEIDGVFTGTFRADQRGTHDVTLEAVTRTLDDRIYTVFENRRVASFEVLGIDLNVANMPAANYLVGERILLEASLTDQNGQPLSMDNVVIVAEQSIASSVVTNTFEYNPTTGLYTLDLPTERAGNYALSISAIMEDGTQTTTLDTTPEARYVILESEIVGLRQILPDENPSNQLTHTGYLPPTRTDLIIEVETYLIDIGEPIVLESIALAPENLWSYNIIYNDERYTNGEVTFGATDTDGRYRLTATRPTAGNYEVTIAASGELEGTYLLQPDAYINTIISVQRNWLPEIMIAVGILVAVLFLLLLVRMQRTRARLSKHPARGVIELQEEETKQMVWRYNLDKQQRNRILIKEAKLHKYGVQSILVECPDERFSRDRKIRVTVEMQAGQRFPNRTLSPGKTLRLFQGSLRPGSGEENRHYILVKDPRTAAL